MIVLDTDHVVVLKYPENPDHAALVGNLNASADQDFAATAVSVEEQMRGWLALIHRYHDVHRQIRAYQRLIDLFDFFSRWRILQFDERAADEFKRLRKEGVRIGTMDLKIATIALVNDALLLSASLGTQLEALRQTVREVRATAGDTGVKIFVGGAALAPASQFASRLGADATPGDVGEAVATAARLVGLDD